MGIIEKWKGYLGLKDERIESESNKVMRVGYTILLVGCAIALYYGIMLRQVAETTDTQLLTAAGERVFPSTDVLLIVFAIGAFVPAIMLTRKGIIGESRRYAELDAIPWGYVTAMGLLCGLVLALLTTVTRILAEVQIVGFGNVTWLGDMAMGVVFFVMGFVVGMIAVALNVKAAIDNRRKMESELED